MKDELSATRGLAPGSAGWWAARATRPRRASKLTAERIVDASVRLLDQEGLEAFSMRRLAGEAGTTAGALYRHFESRDAVLVAVHDRLIGEMIDFDPLGDTWLERVADLARRQRGVLCRRPYLATIWSTTEQLGPNALRARERALKLGIAGGLSPELAVRGYLMLLHYTIAFSVLDQNLSFRNAENRSATERFFRSLPAAEFPTVRLVAGELAHVTIDEEFELGLQAILAGILSVSSLSPDSS